MRAGTPMSQAKNGAPEGGPSFGYVGRGEMKW